MSKRIDKPLKEIEKIKPEKEFTKLEPKELKEPKDFKDKDLKDKDSKDHKDQKDNKEHKEHKDRKDHKEIIKEIHKEKLEPKEFKELAKEIAKEIKEPKEVFEKEPKEVFEGKDLVENQGQIDQGDPVTFSTQSLNASFKASEKQIEKIKAEKEFTKHEPKEIKEYKEPKEFKEHRKEVFEKFPKEHPEKYLVEGGQVDTPGSPVEAGGTSAALEARIARLETIAKNLDKTAEKKIEKVEFKDKNEKIEHKERFEKLPHKEKFEIKELKIEKPEHGKEFIFEKLFEGPIVDPGPLGPDPAQFETFVKDFEATGSVEERVGRLEQALLKMSHFIGVDLRPDLSGGALTREPDAKTPDKKEEDKDKDKKSR